MNVSITVRHCGETTTLRAEAGTPLAPLLREAGLLTLPCGVGKCGRCNIGDKYVCKDGPVFRFDQLDELPNEY